MKNNTPQVRGYKIEGNEIIVDYGWFRKERIPNTTENISKLNLIMKNQIMKNSVSDYQKYKKGTVKYTFISMFVAFGLSLLNAPVLLVAIPSVIAAGYLYTYLSNSYKEYKRSKYEFFFKHQEALNEGISNKPEEEISLEKIQNVNKRTVKAIVEERQHEDKEVFDVNSVRKMSYDSLLNLRENLININLRKKKAEEKAQQQSQDVQKQEQVQPQPTEPVVQEGNGIDAPVLKK